MSFQFSDIGVFIWDFDGTLYRSNSEFWREIRQAEYQLIMGHTGWAYEKTVEEFGKLYKKVMHSATAVVAHLAKIPLIQATTEVEHYFDRTKYVRYDERLVELFSKLQQYRHLILANGTLDSYKKTLAVMGLHSEIFEEIVTPEVVGTTKPSKDGFKHILRKTGLSPSCHLMVGDREAVDLMPARELGMKTCLVWSNVPSQMAGVTIPTIYALEELFTQKI